ncbi:hypothetical protein [Hyphomonas sp.]|jgi:hypothetical protein|uniref:hypothetical protein n=1 Tax=Hyphomonas sp. TaxID=87 RepID=UPI0032EFB5A5
MANQQDLDALNSAMDQALAQMGPIVAYSDPADPMTMQQTVLGGLFAAYVLWSQFFSKDARDARAARTAQDMTLDQARKILGDDMVELGQRYRERNAELESELEQCRRTIAEQNRELDILRGLVGRRADTALTGA